MYTGIIKEIAKVEGIEQKEGIMKLKIKAPISLKDAVIDDSIAVNGVCLTVVAKDAEGIASFDVLAETISRSTLGNLSVGDEVNIESSLTLKDKMGGHIIQGHVDDVVTIKSIDMDGEARIITFVGNKKYMDMMVEKAFIALDGMSLTVVSLIENGFSVMIIPHTFNNTIVKNWKVGSSVNIEIDIINKSIYQYMEIFKNKERL